MLERWTGPAFVHVAGTSATDDVVFGEPADLVLLGSRSLDGLNLRIEPVSKRLVNAGRPRLLRQPDRTRPVSGEEAVSRKVESPEAGSRKLESPEACEPVLVERWVKTARH